MSEEIANAPLLVPQSLLATYLLNGALGFAMLVGVLFALQDPRNALNSPTGYPFMQISLTAINSPGGAIAMAAIPTVLEICATTSAMASASRQFWAFSRDRGVPGWRVFSKIERRSSIPIYAVGLTMITFCTATVGQFRFFGSLRGLGLSCYRWTIFLILDCNSVASLASLHEWN